jgi:hypothetical protein
MIIEAYRWQILLPHPAEELVSAEIRPRVIGTGGPLHHGLAVTTPEEIARRRRETLAQGIPTHIALCGGGYWIFLYPTPTTDYELTITESATAFGRRILREG